MSAFLYPPVSVTTLSPVGGSTLAEQQTQTTALGTINTSINSSKVPTRNQSLVIDNVTVVTITKPANAKGAKVTCPTTNVVNLSITMDGATTPSATTGDEFQPGRSEDYVGVGDLKVIAKTAATNQAVSVQWYV